MCCQSDSTQLPLTVFIFSHSKPLHFLLQDKSHSSASVNFRCNSLRDLTSSSSLRNNAVSLTALLLFIRESYPNMFKKGSRGAVFFRTASVRKAPFHLKSYVPEIERFKNSLPFPALTHKYITLVLRRDFLQNLCFPAQLLPHVMTANSALYFEPRSRYYILPFSIQYKSATSFFTPHCPVLSVL